MTAQQVSSRKKRRNGGVLLLPLALLAVLLASAGFVAYLLWPTWPSKLQALQRPPMPVTVAGALFEIPPAAIRFAVQRHPGPHERIDLAFHWPSLRPLRDAEARKDTKPVAVALVAGTASGMLFVTIERMGFELPPAARLRSVYPRYVTAEASGGPQGLAVLPFRTGTPYEGQDLIYLADHPNQFFTVCTRPLGSIPGTCLRERMLGDADVTLRFPRQWLNHWHSLADGFDRLLAQLYPQSR
jgi:hypothetical protein